MTSGDDGDLVLWLRCTRGDTLTSLLLLLASPKIERERITMTRTWSLDGEAVEGHALSRRQEVPPPVQCEALNLSEEENSLLEAPQRVPFEDEPPMEMTSWSIRGCWIEPLEWLPPMPMAKLNQTEMKMLSEKVIPIRLKKKGECKKQHIICK